MSAPPQIKKNAQWVIDNYGPQSGLPQFGYDPQSIAYLDEFIDRQGASFSSNEQSSDRIVSLLGAFLGEAIIATYGGAWQQSEQGLSLCIQSGGQVHILQPFHKVYKRLTNGPEDSLHFYFTNFLSQVVSQPQSGEEKKPWWKIF